MYQVNESNELVQAMEPDENTSVDKTLRQRWERRLPKELVIAGLGESDESTPHNIVTDIH